MTQKPQTDEALLKSAEYTYKTMCKSVLIATGVGPSRPAERTYYACDVGTKPHDVHYNQQDKWWLDAEGNWQHEGNLTDINFQGAGR